MSKQFLEPSEFLSKSSDYYLLPFRFEKINDDVELLVNEVGDYIFCSPGTAVKIVNREINTESNLFEELISKYFISQEPLPKLLDMVTNRYRTKKSFLDHFTALHIFVMTLRCNHSCQYCQVSRKMEQDDSVDISIEDLDASIDLMFRSPSNWITMEFQGGEPLLVFEKIKYAINKAEELNAFHKKNINYVICTNLTLINQEILSYVKEHDILLSTSLDGSEKVHNYNRLKTTGQSYEKVIESISLAKEYLSIDRISALMTTTRYSLKHPKEIVDSYIENGFNNIFLRSISPYGFASKNRDRLSYDTDLFIEFFKEALNYIIELNNSGVFFVEDYTALIVKKILTPFPIGFVDLQSPAGLISGVVVYNYNGKVYASDEARMLSETGDEMFKLGHVSDSYESIFYGEKAMEIAQDWSIESIPGCSECAFQPYCGADPIRNYVNSGNMVGFRPTSAHCKKNKAIINHIFNLLAQNENNEFHIFKSWISTNN